MLGGAEAHFGYPERAPTASLVAGAVDLFTSGPGLTPQFYSSRQSSCHDVSLVMLIPSLIRQACDEVERILLKSDDISVRPNIQVFLIEIMPALFRLKVAHCSTASSVQSTDGTEALLRAAKSGNLDHVELLFEACVDLAAQDKVHSYP